MEILAAVEAQLMAALGQPQARAAVTFVGAQPVQILRFGPDLGGVARYATLGMSAHPMSDPTEPAPDPLRGPRAELVLSIRARDGAVDTLAAVDTVSRRLAVLAMTPFVEGVVIHPGAGLDLAEPLWEGAGFTAVLVGEGGGLIPALALDPPAEAVRFLPVLPMTPVEAAWKRVHGAEALQERWLRHGVDLRDPHRRAVPLQGPLPGVRA